MYDKLTKEDCINIIHVKFQELNRYPKKSDCSEHEVAMIKSYFGPWPRALECAGIKDISEKRQQHLEKIKQKKIRAKVRKREYILSEKK